MKSRPYLLLIPLFVIATLCLAIGQGTVVIQHNGATDPTTEGFGLHPNNGGGSAKPVFGDLGVNAWQITISNNSQLVYIYSLTQPQQSEIAGSDWILSFTLRDLRPTPVPNDFVQLLGTSSELLGVAVGSKTNGDPYLWGGTSLFTLNGGGAGYHNYEIVYAAATDTASLWVDGTEEVSNFLSHLSRAGGITGLQWGETQSGPSGANWNLVSLEIVPEPSVISLICLGSGVLIYVRNHHGRFTRPVRRGLARNSGQELCAGGAPLVGTKAMRRGPEVK
jgi:hypothetical protein